MAKYRKRPIVVDAHQTDKEIVIHTLEGDMVANIGDWIITGVNGEQYPCKPDIFAKTYTPVTDTISNKSMSQLGDEIQDYREKKGFITSWQNMPTKLMLVVTEVAEAMEAYRRGNKANFDEELADTFIRLLDICSTLGIDIEAEIEKKMEVNRARPQVHGMVYNDMVFLRGTDNET